MRTRLVQPAAAIIVPPAGGLSFAPPDLGFATLNGADDAFWQNQVFPSTEPAPNGYITAAATLGRAGSRCWQAVIAPSNDNGFYPTGPSWPSRGRVFTRWYFRCLTPGAFPSGNVKGWRFQSDGSNSGELYSNLHIALDWEPTGLFGATWYTGLYWGAAPGESGIAVHAINLADGNWHCLQIDYDRNAGPDIHIRLTIDGFAVIHAPQNAPGPFSGGTLVQWTGGDPRTNTPSTFRCARSADPNSVTFLTEVYPFLTISQSGPAATLLMDDCAVSTAAIGECLPSQAGTPQWLHEAWVNASGSPIPIGSYNPGRYTYTTGTGSDLQVAVGGGALMCLAAPAGTNAHVRLSEPGMPTQNYDIRTALQYRTNPNCLSEAYVYLQSDSDSGIFAFLSNGNLEVRPLINGTPGGPIATAPVSGLVNGNWYRLRLGKQGNTVRAMVLGPTGPIVATGSDTTFASGAAGAGAFRAPGGEDVGVGVFDVVPNWGT